MSQPVSSMQKLSVMTAAPTQSPGRRAVVLDRLATEWTHLTMRSADLEAVRRWGLPGGPIRTLDDVLIRSGYLPAPSARESSSTSSATASERAVRPASAVIRPRDGAKHDAYLIRLLAIARHDQLAARIVLQRIIPALCALARRHSPNHASQLDLVDELIGNAWASIRSYPIERRPRWVVPNLVRDIGFQTIVRPARRRNATERPTPHSSLPDVELLTEIEPIDELVALLNDARAKGMSQSDVDLICEIVTLDRPAKVARVRHVSTRTVRNHRDVVVHRLRHLSAVAA